jgi:hypothetical protein
VTETGSVWLSLDLLLATALLGLTVWADTSGKVRQTTVQEFIAAVLLRRVPPAEAKCASCPNTLPAAGRSPAPHRAPLPPRKIPVLARTYRILATPSAPATDWRIRLNHPLLAALQIFPESRKLLGSLTPVHSPYTPPASPVPVALLLRSFAKIPQHDSDLLLFHPGPGLPIRKSAPRIRR